MLTAIKYNLAHLTDFAGREARQTFWFYVLFLVIVQFAISFAISLPLTGSMMGDAIGAVREGAGEAEMHQRIFAHVSTMMRVSLWSSVVLSLAMVALLFAAFVRRLHDSGKPGWIAAVAAVVNVVALVLTIMTIDDAITMMILAQTGDVSAMQELRGRFVLQGLLSWIPAILLVVFGVWPSTPGDNRYGPQPQPL